nr:MAG TPA: hypothetical protein [Crassvirales sp.]
MVTLTLSQALINLICFRRCRDYNGTPKLFK